MRAIYVVAALAVGPHALSACHRSKKQKCEAMRAEIGSGATADATDDVGEAFMGRCMKLDDDAIDCVAASVHQQAEGGRRAPLSPACEETIKNLRVQTQD